MRKIGLVAAVTGLLVMAPSVLAHAPLSGTACTGTKLQRAISLHVHGMKCSVAYTAVSHGSSVFTCKSIGETTKLPVTVKCFKTKHKSTYYEYLASGG
jgi:hypothetical protein